MVLIALPESEPPAYPPCETLRQARIRARLSQPKLSVLCFLAQLALESPSHQEAHPTRSASPETLMLAVIFLRQANCVDSTHLSKFERGHQRPWKKARQCLCFVFSQVTKRNVTEEELFPEIEDGFNDPLLSFTGALEAAQQAPFTSF